MKKKMGRSFQLHFPCNFRSFTYCNMKINKGKGMLKRKKDGREHMKINKERVMLKRKRDGREHNRSSEVVDKKDSAVLDDDKKMGRKLLHACSTKVSDSKTRNEEVIRKAEEEENRELELPKESRPSKRHKGNDEDEMTELPGIPLAPSVKSSKSGVIFVLEKASLTLASVGRKFQILNPDDHATFMRKKNMNPYNYRPDIIHEALRAIMDCRLRMAGRLKAVYIKTDEGVLIKVEPNALIPENLGEFFSMMAELLQKLSIKAKGKGGKLLRVVENPVTRYLPVNSRKIGLSYSSKKAVDLRDYVNAINHDEDLVFVVGAMAHGKIDSDYIDDLISVNDFPLSAALCLGYITGEVERRWNIL